jgi:hypothetical protein
MLRNQKKDPFYHKARLKKKIGKKKRETHQLLLLNPRMAWQPPNHSYRFQRLVLRDR